MSHEKVNKANASDRKDGTDPREPAHSVSPVLKCALGVFKRKSLCTWDLDAFQDSGMASSQGRVKQHYVLNNERRLAICRGVRNEAAGWEAI